MLRTVTATRYLTPLREGGSLPGLVEADDDGTYVVKFSGAGQGLAALVAEIVVGELARALGVRVPEQVLLDLDAGLAVSEPDEEVQDLLRASVGRNLGIDFLPGSLGYDGTSSQPPAAEALRILWLDAFTANVDRSWRNPNLLVWHRELWAIDHGAALVFHHAWKDAGAWASRRYDLTSHVLLPVPGTGADALLAADADLAAAVPAVLDGVLALVPDAWVTAVARTPDADAGRARYRDYLTRRLAPPRPWLLESLRPEAAR